MSDEDKVINVKFKYTQEGAEQVAAQAKAAREPLWGKSADDFYAKQAQGWDALGKDFLDFQKQYENGTQNMEARTKQFKKEMNELYGEMRGLRYAAMGIGQLGSLLTIGGGLLTAGIVAEAGSYVKIVGNITDESAKWLGYQRDIKESNLEIGKTATQALLPAMSMAASLMERIAGIVKANPWIVTAALGVGSAMLVLGTAATIISKMMTVVADLGLAISKIATTQLGQALGMGPLAEGAGIRDTMAGIASMPASGLSTGAIATLTVGSLVVGSIIGVGVGNFVGDLMEKLGVKGFENYKHQNLADAFVTMHKIIELPWLGLAHVIGSLVPALDGSMTAFTKWIIGLNTGLAELLGATSAQKPEGKDSTTTQAEVEAYINFEKQMNDATNKYSQQRLDIIKDYEKQVAEATAQYERQRVQVIEDAGKQAARASEDFALAQARALESYNNAVDKSNAQYALNEDKARENFQRQQEKATADFNRSQTQMAKDHSKELMRLAMQHEMRMSDLIGQRDALGIVKENRKYQMDLALKTADQQEARQQARNNFRIQRAEAEQAYNQQRADAKKAHELQLAELRKDYDKRREEAEQNYNIQRERAAEDLRQRLEQMASAHKLQMEAMAKQEQEKLDKLDEAYDKQISQIKTAFIDRLRALDAAILGDTVAFNNYMKREAANFQNWLNNYKAQTLTNLANTGGAKAGGSVHTMTPLQQYHAATGHQYGGYGEFSGPGEMGNPEFVFDDKSTRMAESLIGSRLTQANVLSAIMAGKGNVSGSGKTVQITVKSQTLTVSQILKHIDSALDMKLGEILAV